MRKTLRTCDARGFTLLELLVTIILVAMVTLMLSNALKVGIQAWQRGTEGGDAQFLRVSIPGLLERQLATVIQDAVSSSGQKMGRFPFCGDEHALSFFSTFGPMGSSLQGVLRISYIYRPDEETLFLYEQVVTSSEDLRDELNPYSQEWNGALKPLSEVKGISSFDLMYSNKKIPDTDDSDQWKNEWKCNSPISPSAIRLGFSTETEKNETDVWYFHVGQQSGS